MLGYKATLDLPTACPACPTPWPRSTPAAWRQRQFSFEDLLLFLCSHPEGAVNQTTLPWPGDSESEENQTLREQETRGGGPEDMDDLCPFLDPPMLKLTPTSFQ